MDRRHFIGQSAAALGLLAGFSGHARANLQKAEILVIGSGSKRINKPKQKNYTCDIGLSYV